VAGSERSDGPEKRRLMLQVALLALVRGARVSYLAGGNLSLASNPDESIGMSSIRNAASTPSMSISVMMQFPIFTASPTESSISCLCTRRLLLILRL
jgi:hypothetical protein